MGTAVTGLAAAASAIAPGAPSPWAALVKVRVWVRVRVGSP